MGASPRPDTVGFRIVRNLRSLGLPGPVFPINPRYPEIDGLRCYPSLTALPQVVETIAVAVPAAAGPEVLAEAAACGVKAAFVPSAGYADAGPDGQVLQSRLCAVAAQAGIALCGPNNMGLINVHDRAALWMAARFPEMRPGPLAVISQSGSVAIALSQDERRLGLSYVVSTGNEAQLTVADYLRYLAADDRVALIAVFLETLRDPATFADASRLAHRRGKRILAVKVGRTETARVAVAAHTGALSGEDEVYGQFLRHHGVVRVHDLDELLETATLCARYPAPPSTSGTVVVTLSGGEAALIADVAASVGLELPSISVATVKRLRPAFPVFVTPRNPLDAWGLGFTVERFRHILATLAADPAVGTIAVSLDAPVSGGADAGLGLRMAQVCADSGLAWGKRLVFFNNTSYGLNGDIARTLDAAGIPYLSGMRAALVALASWAHAPIELRDEPRAETATARRSTGDLWRLSVAERFRRLGRIGLPMVECVPAQSADDAVAAAAKVGYPVALKAGGQIAHKTDRGLVRLGLGTEGAVRSAFADVARAMLSSDVEVLIQPMIGPGLELMVGVRNDPAFGSLTVVGLGGIYVELWRRSSLRIGPVDVATARAMLGECGAAPILAGARGRGPYDSDAAASAIAALSVFGWARRDVIGVIEVNPVMVLAAGHGAFGVDLLLERPAADGRLF